MTRGSCVRSVGAGRLINRRHETHSQPAFPFQRRIPDPGARFKQRPGAIARVTHLERNGSMLMRILKNASLLASSVAIAGAIMLTILNTASTSPANTADGVVTVRSAYGMDETIQRLKADIASKKIKFFDQIDQAKLASAAGIELRPSTLLIFGNPPLGTQFITSNPLSGLDWPVRLLVFQDKKGQVWTAYTDFAWIAQRHEITDRQAQFKMASMVIESITASVKAK
jgi:uncharacterized protein (DUF302 family)